MPRNTQWRLMRYVRMAIHRSGKAIPKALPRSKQRRIRPLSIPDDFVLLIDTREQEPLFIHARKELLIEHKALKHGDYSVKGYEDVITIERKKLSDFYGYIGRERKKTEKKIDALRQMFWAALIIEANENDLRKQYKYGKVTPEHARGFILSLRIRYGIHVYINKDRKALERYVLEHLIKAYTVTKETPNGK